MRQATFWSIAAFVGLAAPAAAQQSPMLPLHHTPQPTTAAISAADLMTRLYIFSDDSMQGRETGTVGHVKSTDYIARELKRLGLEPAGDDGGFFQNVPVIRRAFDTTSVIVAGGTTLRGGVDFLATTRGEVPSLDGVQAMFGGTMLDTTNVLTPEQVAGKLLILERPEGGNMRGRFFGRRGGAAAFQAYLAMSRAAAAVATIADELDPAQVQSAVHPREGNVSLAESGGQSRFGGFSLTITAHAAQALLGTPVAQATKGQAGQTVRADIRFNEEPAPARNVVAILRGSDPQLRNEYVAIGAHDDHLGIRQGPPVDSDSLHLYNAARFAIVGMIPRGQQPTPEQSAEVEAIHINLDSVHAAHPERLDSIANGADDDGSGSVTVLEIAEAFAKAPARPKRSILFVWHVGEEKGLWGSRWFTEHPTVPRDSIVAQLNMDMVGRGASRDLPVGSPDYLALVGSRRLSTELGDIVEQVNADETRPLKFDYEYDAPGHPENIYCRSDHWNYARWGIPIVFFTTGLHGDYHQVTDEPQYIDYPHMARIAQLVYDIASDVADLDHRPVIDHDLPDPNGPCRQ